MRKSDQIIKDVFGGMKFTYPIRGIALKEHRTALGISRKEFAKLCGWPTTFQTGLEEPRTNRRYLSCFQRDRIVAAIILLCRKNLKKVVKTTKNLS